MLRELYGIRPPSTEDHFKLASKFTSQLDEWHDTISYLLETDGDSAIFVKLVLRQRDVLKLAFWHARVLVHRPFLLNSFASLANYSTNRRLLASRRAELQQNVQHCLDAAMRIVQLIDRIDAAGEFYSTLFVRVRPQPERAASNAVDSAPQFIPYYGFSAVAILYVYAIQQRTEAPETYLSFFHAASKCHAQLEGIAAKGSLMQRYGVVLQELRLELLQHNEYLASAATPDAGGHTVPIVREALGNGSPARPDPSLAQIHTRTSFDESQGHIDAVSQHGGVDGDANGLGMPMNHENGMAFSDDGNALGQIFGTDSVLFSGEGMDGSIAQMAGWGHFDSLVSRLFRTGALSEISNAKVGHRRDWQVRRLLCRSTCRWVESGGGCRIENADT